MASSVSRPPAYRTIWRWHFYAGLFVLPFILILSVTGSIYLFKPQIDRWEERSYRGLGTGNAVSADTQLATALAAYPKARFHHYRLPERPGDAAMIHFSLPDGSERDVYVSPQGEVIGAIDPPTRISEVVARIHGTLLLGQWGDWLVELAASWTIVMILTGLYLWWPRPFRFAGTLWPRPSLRGRALLKDIHRVTGFWIAGLVLVMLASGLPWAGAWGSAFQWARTELGWVQGPQSWQVGSTPKVEATHAHHGPSTMAQTMPPQPPRSTLPLSSFIAKARNENMAFPVLVLPPHVPQRFGPPTGDEWTVKSAAQNRLLQRQVTYDPAMGKETGRRGFADQHVIDRAINIGVAWHEGQLFGLANQLLGLATALALIAVSLLGIVMWLKRRPNGQMGAPVAPDGVRMRWAFAALVALGLLLPLFGLSLLLMTLIDRLRAVARH